MRQIKVSSSITPHDEDSFERYLNDVKKQKLLTINEECEYARKARNGDRNAINELVLGNLRFVVSIAKQYQHRGLQLQDLINEGNIGLIKAAQKFDETRGFKFISYAVWWIRQMMITAINQKGNSIHIPINQTRDMWLISKAINTYELSNNRAPELEELEKITEIPGKHIVELIDKRDSYNVISLDKPFSDENDHSLIDLLNSTNQTLPDYNDDKESLAHEIQLLFRLVLDERESNILKQIFGIGTAEKNLTEIAASTGLSRERIRQIKDKAIRKLRTHKGSANLIPFLG